jgi:acetate kinase
MGTRPGDLDPGVVLTLLREYGATVDDVDRLLNQASGLKGLSGIGNDLREIEDKAAAGDDRARLAIATARAWPSPCSRTACAATSAPTPRSWAAWTS